MTKIYNFYIISLFEALDRIENVIELTNKLKKKGYNVNIIKAFYYKTVDIHNVLKDENIMYACKNNSLSKTQVGCFLSHREAWKAIMKGKSDEVHIIMEDDMTINENMELYDFNNIPEYDAVVLWRHPEQLNNPTTYVKEGLLNFYHQWGTCTYAVTPEMAKELVENIKEIDIPIDNLLCRDIYPKKRVYVVEESPFINLGMIGGYSVQLPTKFRSWIYG